MLRPTDRPLNEIHDLAVLDLDGVVYIGPHAVDGAVDALAAARTEGMRLAYVTNNASRTPEAVAAQLVDLGFEVVPDDVVTSAQAAARVLREQLDPGAKVYVIGGEGLVRAVESVGLSPITELAEAGEDLAAVVQGYGPDVVWRRILDGAILVRQGLPWVATNIDATIPTARGIGPGNGALVDLIARFAGRDPVVAGKPEAPLFEETRDRMDSRSPLVVGDRLDTDIAGAVRLDWPALLVMTGVTGVAELVAATEDQRPTYLAPDLSALTHVHAVPEARDGGWVLEDWRASVENGSLRITGSGSTAAWWRVLAASSWDFLDTTGAVVRADGVTPPE